MDVLFEILARTLLVLFAVGTAGCLLVIPITAVELFKTLFEPDTQDEIEGKIPNPAGQP
jgi:hypothetical protein